MRFSQGLVELVERVKRVQRASAEAREVWHQLCDAHRAGMRDPTKLDAQFLQHFLTTASQGIQGHSAPVPAASDQDKVQRSVLVQRVEDMLQESGRLRRAWARMCEVDCGGEREPAQADAAFIQRFLVKHDDGTRRTSVASVPAEGLQDLASAEQVERVKQAQRASAHWREAWQAYCDERAKGMRDPAGLPADFVQTFLDQVKAQDPTTFASLRHTGEKRPHIGGSTEEDDGTRGGDWPGAHGWQWDQGWTKGASWGGCSPWGPSTSQRWPPPWGWLPMPGTAPPEKRQRQDGSVWAWPWH